MPAASRIVSLNLGSQTLGLAEFFAQPNGGLVLAGYQLQELPADPLAESDRNRQISQALPGMMYELGFKGGPVDYAVSGQSVFARFVKLPAVDQDKIERIITFEAQQNVPFPIEEVVWDYQLVGTGEADKIEVVLVAIKADLLEGINEAVEATGLETTRVDVATMALYNAFRFNYSELTGCSLLIDIGARTTNLLFIEPGKVFSRSIPIGGSSITSAIAREFHEPFAAAELRKKHDGFVSLGGAYAEASDPQVARVSKLVRNTMTRLHSELTRSISFYRTQQQGNTPQRVFLYGGTVTTPYMREFFHEKLQWPIEFFNPLRNVAVAPERVSHSAHLLGELIGLALRRIMTCPMELNLRPANVVRRQRLAERRPFLLLAARTRAIRRNRPTIEPAGAVRLASRERRPIDYAVSAAYLLDPTTDSTCNVGMRKILLGTLASLAIVGSSLGATCVGASPCHACSTCGYCGHCAKQGGTCGVCANGKHTPKHHAAVRKHKPVVIAQK